MHSSEHRAEWAEQFGRYAESLSAEGRSELWFAWVAEYWDDRLTGVPQLLDDPERQAMVGWIVPFRDVAAEVVKRVARTPPRRIDSFVTFPLQEEGLAASDSREVGQGVAREGAVPAS